jgi:hypothetical protein
VFKDKKESRVTIKSLIEDFDLKIYEETKHGTCVELKSISCAQIERLCGRLNRDGKVVYRYSELDELYLRKTKSVRGKKRKKDKM